MQDLNKDLAEIFGKEPRENELFVKINVEKLNDDTFKSLYLVRLKHSKKIKDLKINRSGKGLVILIEKM